jgi:hypothetical protein
MLKQLACIGNRRGRDRRRMEKREGEDGEEERKEEGRNGDGRRKVRSKREGRGGE